MKRLPRILGLPVIFLIAAGVGIFPTWYLKKTRSAEKPVTLYLMWEPQAQFLGYYAARERGFFRDEGINIVIKHDLGFGESFHEILAKPNTYAINLLSNTIEWLAESKEFSALSVISTGCNMGWVSPFPKEQLIQKMSMAPVFSWWGTQDILLKNFLLQNSFSLADFSKRAHVGDPEKSADNWIVLVMGYNELVDYRHEYDPDRNFATYCELGQPIFEDILVGTVAKSPEQKSVHKKMVRAIWKGWDWSVRHPDEALDLLMTLSPRRPRPIQKYQLGMFAKNLAGRGDKARNFSGNLRTLRALISHGLIQRPAHLDALLESLAGNVNLREIGI
jgi:NitT/TauT family transport system substrate-binding protein